MRVWWGDFTNHTHTHTHARTHSTTCFSPPVLRLPASFQNVSHLRALVELNLDSNQIEIVENLAGLRALEVLSLANNKIVDAQHLLMLAPGDGDDASEGGGGEAGGGGGGARMRGRLGKRLAEREKTSQGKSSG